MENEVADKKEQKSIHKITNWSLFVALAVIIIAGAGLYILNNEDRLNDQILEGTQNVQVVKENKAAQAIDPDTEVKEIDDQMNTISDEDFTGSLLDDVNLSIQ